MDRIIKTHVGNMPQENHLPMCYECCINKDEVWECKNCGRLFCEDHIIQEGNGIDDITFICIDCQNKRMEG